MQGIEFEDEVSGSSFSVDNSNTSGGKSSLMFRTLGALGITDKATANFILLGIAAGFLTVAFFLYADLIRKNIPSNQDAAQVAARLKMMQEMQGIK